MLRVSSDLLGENAGGPGNALGFRYYGLEPVVTVLASKTSRKLISRYNIEVMISPLLQHQGYDIIPVENKVYLMALFPELYHLHRMSFNKIFNKIAIQATALMAADKEAIGLSCRRMALCVSCSYEIIVYSVLKHAHNQLTIYSTHLRASLGKRILSNIQPTLPFH